MLRRVAGIGRVNASALLRYITTHDFKPFEDRKFNLTTGSILDRFTSVNANCRR
jgi:hypothetical protein